MAGARASRSDRGLSSTVRREVPRLWLMPSTPTKKTTLSTAGSCRIRSASWRWRSAMAVKDVSCGASAMPWITPVSCTGKKPLGTTMYSTTVSARVPRATPRVRR